MGTMSGRGIASLVGRAHAAIGVVLRTGSIAVDATAGNGHDTAFLAACVGPRGRVFGFDIQPAALATTRARLVAEGLAERVTLVHSGHEDLTRHIPARLHGKVRAVMFNLGYLPGGDKTRTTRPQTTLAALDGALCLLAPTGRLSVLAYTGHPGGRAETDGVLAWTRALDPVRFRTEATEPAPSCRRSAPVLLMVESLPE